MTKEDIKREITKLKKKINSLESENQKYKKEIKEAENAIGVLSKIALKIESFLNDCYSSSYKVAQTLPEGSIFGENYLKELNGILKGSESSMAFSSISDSKRDLFRKIESIESIINRNNSLVKAYEQKIRKYQNQLAQS